MKRFPELDGFRGFLAIAVMLIHCSVQPMYWMNIGMDCFFTMSAFLITLGLMAAEDYGLSRSLLLKDFFIRRTARIFPMYYAMLAAIAVLFVALSLAPASMALKQYALTDLIPYVLYLQFTELYGFTNESAIWDQQIRFIYHTWSLAVEEQFYVLWGFTFVLVRGVRPRAVVALLFIAIGLSCRASGVVMSPLLPYRLDAFGYGILMSLLVHSLTRTGNVELQRSCFRIGAACFLIILPTFLITAGVIQDIAGWRRGIPIEYWEWSPISALTAGAAASLVACLIFGAEHWIFAPFRTRPMRYLGSTSYAIYLIHYPVVDLTLLINHAPLNANNPLHIVLVVAIVVGLAHVATRIFSRVSKAIVSAAIGRSPPPPATAAAPQGTT